MISREFIESKLEAIEARARMSHEHDRLSPLASAVIGSDIFTLADIVRGLLNDRETLVVSKRSEEP